ncbi:PXA domain-containing protein [Hypoxylon crocopeplum]|nr:PXA domain-containing protein [Hypoxylon crocopeplum]
MEPSMRRAASNACWTCLRLSAANSSRPPVARRHVPPTEPQGTLSRSISLFGQQSKPAEDDSIAPLSAASYENPSRPPILRPDDLFHSFTNSPIPEIRRRAAFIRQHAYCPHPDHRPTRMSSSTNVIASNSGAQAPIHVDFECPDCGVPVYCSEKHWAEDYEAHLQICDTLRQINEDDHDLRSGRFFPEFEYAGPQMEEAAVNMTNWDTFLYTRQFEAINDDRSMRQVTRLLTYPLTIGSIIHELSPYNIRKGGRLTPEGLKSLSALRYTLHPPRTGGGEGIKGLRPEAPPVRIFILGARAESSLPRNVWVQLAHLFPRGKFHLIFIGPESMANRDDEFPLPPRTPSNPFGAIVEDRVWPTMKISTIVDYYHTLHKTGQFYPYDPYFDCFVMFHPGLGHAASSHEWTETVPLLLETKAPIIVTGYTQYDMDRDIEWVRKTCGGEFDILMEPGENTFRSLRWDLNDLDPQDISCGNWGVWAFRGKRQLKPTVSGPIPSKGGPVPTSLKAPATSSTNAESVTSTATGNKSSSPLHVTPPPLAPRRPTRPVSSDFLSDKATAALIRRVLCAQHLTDRGRSTPAPIQDLLPPLTSRNDVDLQLYALIAIIIKEFVQNWYTKITPDETFVAEIVQIIAHCTRALEQRLRKVDLESLLFDELPELLDAHIRAYRIAKSSVARPPVEANPREIYHSLWPLPALSPVPKSEHSSVQAQADNESTYRQLLVQGVLALLLPTEDLENECLTALVGQLFSELIIGNLIVNKLSEPWLIWEGLIILTRVVRARSKSEASGPGIMKSNLSLKAVSSTAPPPPPPASTHSFYIQQTFWSMIQWGFAIVNTIRLIISTLMLSKALPPRSTPAFIRQVDPTSHGTEEKSYDPPTTLEARSQPVRVPVADFKIWSCVGNLLEIDARMPWMSGALSMVQWGALRGPGSLAGFNGMVDR